METRIDDNGLWVRTGRYIWILTPDNASPTFEENREATGNTLLSKTTEERIADAIAAHEAKFHVL